MLKISTCDTTYPFRQPNAFSTWKDCSPGSPHVPDCCAPPNPPLSFSQNNDKYVTTDCSLLRRFSSGFSTVTDKSQLSHGAHWATIRGAIRILDLS